MVGSIRHPYPSPRDVRAADPEALRELLAKQLDVDPRRVFLTHGASESNAATLQYIARAQPNGFPRCRIRFPEYPPLVDYAGWCGLRPTESSNPAAVAVVSQPRNPEGDLWSPDRLLRWSDGADQLLLDETFREFSGTPSQLTLGRKGVWVSGTLTKFYAGDDVRVGFLVVPDEVRERFARFHGLATDTLAEYSVAAALRILHDRDRLRRQVMAILAPNRAAWSSMLPGTSVPRGPVGFDRDIAPDGDALARRCLSASVLVCPGRFFGEVGGVRLGMTRRSFPADLRAYLRVRERLRTVSRSRSRSRRPARSARPLPGRGGRANAGPG